MREAEPDVPVLPGAQRVELAGAAHGDDQQEATHQAAHRRRRDDLARQDHGAVELVCAVLAVHLAVTAPALKDAPAAGGSGNRSRVVGLKNILIIISYCVHRDNILVCVHSVKCWKD